MKNFNDLTEDQKIDVLATMMTYLEKVVKSSLPTHEMERALNVSNPVCFLNGPMWMVSSGIEFQKVVDTGLSLSRQQQPVAN